MDAKTKGDIVRDELQSLLDRLQDYQPIAWARAWTYAAEMGVEILAFLEHDEPHAGAYIEQGL